LVVGWGVRFLVGRADGSFAPAPIAGPVPAAVVGRWHAWRKPPPPEDLVQIEVPSGAQRCELEVDGRKSPVELEGSRSKKRFLFWYGESSALGGASWDDVELVDVSHSGDTPFHTRVVAHADEEQGRLGLADVLVEDPDQEGTKRSLRYALVR